MSNPLKKTMVFLGLAEEDFDEVEPAETVTKTKPDSAERPPVQKAAPVTPLRRVTPAPVAPEGAMNEILTVHPTQYSDAQMIAENFRDGVPVILNLSRMNDGDAKRLIDFASGLVTGLSGKIERVTSKVFLLSPEHVAVSGEERGDADRTGSFFVNQG